MNRSDVIDPEIKREVLPAWHKSDAFSQTAGKYEELYHQAAYHNWAETGDLEP